MDNAPAAAGLSALFYLFKMVVTVGRYLAVNSIFNRQAAAARSHLKGEFLHNHPLQLSGQKPAVLTADKPAFRTPVKVPVKNSVPKIQAPAVIVDSRQFHIELFPIGGNVQL